MNEIIVRFAIKEDAKKLSILFKQVYIQTYAIEGVSDEFANFIIPKFSVERIEQTIIEYPENIIVASIKNNLVGVAELELNKKMPIGELIGPELNKLYILEWFCGQGIGSQLLNKVENVLIDRKNDSIWLWVLETNLRAIEFYERNGFVTIGNADFQMEQNNYHNKVMIKKLAPAHNRRLTS